MLTACMTPQLRITGFDDPKAGDDAFPATLDLTDESPHSSQVILRS